MLITDIKKYQTPHRVWQGIPGIVHTKGVRTFASFYSGHVSETYGDFAAIIMSEDEKNYTEPIAVAFKDGPYRCFDSGLWIDPLGRLWFYWNVMPGEEVYAVICDNPDANELIWGEEFYIGRGIMMNKPTVLSTGEWLFPITVWAPELMYDLRKRGIIEGEESAAFVYKTADNGKTFPYRLLIDERKNVSYPDAMECDDGYIRIVYDRERGSYKHSLDETYACAREILTAKITEDALLVVHSTRVALPKI